MRAGRASYSLAKAGILALWLAGVSLALGGCSSATLRQTRSLLERDDLSGAVEAAGDDRLALEEVALAVLARGMTDPATRPQAAAGLRSAGYLARSTLGELTGSEDAAVSAVAASILAAQGDRRARESLEDLLAHSDGEIRAAALQGVRRSRDELSFFRPFLQDPDARVRSVAVQALGRLEGEEIAPLLSETVRRDPAVSVRSAALRALSRVDSSEALLEAVRHALAHGESALTSAAIDALARLDDRETARALLTEQMAEGEPPVAIRAAAVLARDGDQAARTYLQRSLAEGPVAEASAAAIGAGQVGEDMRDALIAALDRPEPEVRMQVAAELLDLDERERAVETLTELVEQPGWIGLQAAIALAHAGNEDVGPRLARGLEDEDPSVRAAAARACGRLYGGARIAREALDDEASNVRIAAASSVLQRFLLGRNG